jgi:dihydrofolate reductase
VRKLCVFNQLSADGYFCDKQGDMSWAKAGNDDEFNQFRTDNASGGGVLVFGRVTYDLMISFWPTPQAAAMLPVVAERMNNLPKVVFSRTLTHASWNNTRLMQGDLIAQMRELKAEAGQDLVILGSGSLVSQLAGADLIDEYQFVEIPIALGGGRTLFEGIGKALPLELTKSRIFKNGKVFLAYEPSRGKG